MSVLRNVDADYRWFINFSPAFLVEYLKIGQKVLKRMFILVQKYDHFNYGLTLIK